MKHARALVIALSTAVNVSCGAPSDPGLSEPARFEGRALMFADAQGKVPTGLKVTLGDGTEHAISSSDGTFSISNSGAQLANAKLVFTGVGALPALVRTAAANAKTNVVLVPDAITIPSCSVHRGQTVPLDLIKAYKPIAAGQNAYFDRANTLTNSGLVAVASWNAASIPVALSDTGGVTKRFTAQDSSELATVLAMFTSYVCQSFHMAPLADARREGIVVVKDPAFAALGAHSMALPTTRGDYERAEVVLRRVSVDDGVVRDSVRRTVMHEFLHVLGFGHTCGWPTVMTTGTICPEGTYTFVPSPQDVAHYFAMRYARQGERTLNTVMSLGVAYQGSLVANGQAELPIAAYFTRP